MYAFRKPFLCVAVLLGALVARAAVPPPTAAPACRVAFALPLADGSTAAAVCLPGANGQTLIVYVAAGKLVTGVITLDGATPPVVDPPPPVIPPVVPPVDPAGKPQALIVVTDKPVDNPPWKSVEITNLLTVVNKLPPPYEYNLSLVADPKADPVALKWIGKSAIGNTSYPFFFFVTDKGEVLEQGPLGKMASGILFDVLYKHLNEKKAEAKR